MRWKGGRRSDNVEDRRGQRMGRAGLPGGLRLPIGGKGGGCGTVIAILIVLYLLNSGTISLTDLGGLQPQPGTQNSAQNYPSSADSGQTNAAQDPLADFVSVVLADTEDTWNALFQQAGQRYREPTLVLFSDYVRSACGMAQTASGPFYCPADQTVYIDLYFYQQLRERHNAPGDFAQAYVIAHEVGHHVQTLLGITQKVQDFQRRAPKVEANQMLVRLELQADCFAGLWAHHADRTRQVLEQGDIEEALNAAAQIGDDTLQRQAQGYVVPEAFTHGSAEQRARWFKRGFSTGDVSQCDTLNATRL